MSDFRSFKGRAVFKTEYSSSRAGCLENKGYLKVDSIGKSYTRTGKAYVAAISKEAYREQKAFLDAISHSRDTETGVLDFLTAYVKSANMSPDFPERIRKVLESC